MKLTKDEAQYFLTNLAEFVYYDKDLSMVVSWDKVEQFIRSLLEEHNEI
jgi:hypothetical protein